MGLPLSAGGVDKRVKITARQRVDVTDFEYLGKYERLALANMTSAILAENTGVIGGMKVVTNFVETGNANNMTVWTQVGAILDGGYLGRLTAHVQHTVPANTSGSTRTDNVSVRYSESETDSTARKGLVPIVRVTVTSGSPETVGVSDGTTLVYDLGHAGVESNTLVVRVNGDVVAFTLVPGTGGAGVDQIAFASAPAPGATITASYTWRQGGTETPVTVNTSYAASAELIYTAGSASAPAGYTKIAEISVLNGATSIATDKITDSRPYVFGADGLSLPRQFSLGALYARFGTDVGVDLLSGTTLTINVHAGIINGVRRRITGGTHTAASILADGLSLTNNTRYYVYACMRRDVSVTSDVEFVLTTTAPESTRNFASASMTRTIGGTAVVFAAVDCLYMGTVKYGVGAFYLQKRIGDRVYYSSDKALSSQTSLAVSTYTIDASTNDYVPPTATAVLAHVDVKINDMATAAGTVFRAGPATSSTFLRVTFDYSRSVDAVVEFPFMTAQNIYCERIGATGTMDAVMTILGYSEPLV